MGLLASTQSASALEKEKYVVTLGETAMTNEGARVCFTRDAARGSLNPIDSMPHKQWQTAWYNITVMSALCAQGVVRVRFLGVVSDEDGNWETWTDFEGETWRIVFCEAWFESGNYAGKHAFVWFMLTNEIRRPDHKGTREERDA